MAAPNELRLFISSTFRDMQEEREHLVKKIFPEIRALCRERGVAFTEIDLRWGLTDEEAIRGQVVRTCLEEVDRCRPLFLGMIGHRYGWIPEYHEIAMDPDLLTRFPWVEEMAMEGTSVTEMEFIHGVFNASPGDDTHALFYYRTVGDAESGDRERLDRLIDRLRTTGHPLHPYGSLEDLGAMVRGDLLAIIDHYWPEEEAPGPLDLERRAHAAFAASRTRAYIPDPLSLQEFTRWYTAPEGPLVVLGPSGLGKSSLLAWLADSWRRKNPDGFTVEYFVGASERSGTAAAVMQHFIEEIRDRFGIDESVPDNEDELERLFPNWLFRAAHLADRERLPVLFVIDALNRLDDRGHRLAWLPENIPQSIRLLVSTTPDGTGERLPERGWPTLHVKPFEEERLRQSVMVRYLGEFRKSISSAQLQRITGDRNSPSPLFLRTVAEELRLHGTHETLDEQIDRFIGAENLLQIFDVVLQRIERDHGEQEVRSLLSLIHLSRSGLSEPELIDLTDISRLELSRLLFAFDYHLLRRDGYLTFFHDFLRRAVENRYLNDPERAAELRRRLAGYFESADLTRRTAQELIEQYRSLGEKGLLAETLSRPAVTHLLFTGETRFLLMAEWSRLRADRYDPASMYHAAIINTDEAVPSPPCLSVARLLEDLGEPEESAKIYRIAIDRVLLPQEGDTLLQCYCGIGRLCVEESRFDDARHYLETALEQAERAGDRRTEMIALGQIGILHAHRGQYEEALRFYAEQKAIGLELHDRNGLYQAIGNAGLVHGYRGDNEQALACHREVLATAEDLGDRIAMATALGNIGMLQAGMNAYEEALENHRKGLAISRELGDRGAVARGYENLAQISFRRGEVDESLEYYRKSLDVYEELGRRRNVATVVGHIATIHLQTGEVEIGRSWFERALSIASEINHPRSMSNALGGLANIHYMQREYDRAIARYREQIAVTTELGDRSGTAFALGNLGLAHKGAGDYAEARDCFVRQRDIWTELKDFRGIGISYGCLGDLDYEQGERADALRNFLQAYHLHRPIDYRFGLGYWLTGIAQILCDLCRSENPTPDDLIDDLGTLTGEAHPSREIMLEKGRTMAGESLEMAKALRSPDIAFNAGLVVETAAALAGDVDGAAQRLKEMLEETDLPERIAALSYTLWKITGEEEWRQEGVRSYEDLLRERPVATWRVRVREMEASAATDR